MRGRPVFGTCIVRQRALGQAVALCPACTRLLVFSELTGPAHVIDGGRS